MTVKELITQLLNEPMGSDVTIEVYNKGERTSIYLGIISLPTHPYETMLGADKKLKLL